VQMSLMPLPPTEGYACYLATLNTMDGSATQESPDSFPGRDASQPQLPTMEFKKSLDDLDEEDDADKDEEDDDDLEDEEDEDEDEVDDDYDEDEDEDDDEEDDEDEDEEDEDGGVKPLKMA
jgi:hypothetical protein